MAIIFKAYQDKAVDELVRGVADLMSVDASNKVCVFQSPTGSGKTIMVASFIDNLIKELPDSDLCFLWVSIGKGELHKQSKKSLDVIFDGFPKVNLLEQEFFGHRAFIEQNEVVVVNWEKIRSKDSKTGEWKNKLMAEGENINFIEVLGKTKEKRKIILIIDESHYASDAKRTNELRQIINADVTLEMSATPKIQPSAQDIARGIAKFVYVDSKEVIEAGMIKKELIINENINDLVDDEKTSQEIIIEAAYNKRLKLKEDFTIAGASINPLCLIQLPNSEAGATKREVVEAFLADKGITESNGKLAVWLSEDKSDNLDVISDFNSEVEFLLFKQAIDTGWDCPRAHILVKLRDIQSFTFEIQTVGRILRMPQQKHYENENLNRGYIFTNLQSITVAKEEYNPNIIKHLKATRKKIYEPLKLQSYYKNRVDFGDITYSFGKILEKVFCEEFGIEINPTIVNIADNANHLNAKGLSTNLSIYKESLVSDKNISSASYDDIIGELNTNTDTTTEIRLADNDLQDSFNAIINSNLSGFAPKRSIPTVKGAIYHWFKKYLGINYHIENGAITIQNLFLDKRNIEKFTQLLSKSTGDFRPIKKEEIKNKIEETFYPWDIIVDEFYNQHSDSKYDYKLCIYEPCYLSTTRSTPEQEFEIHIETKGDNINWWFKNGVKKKDFLGIKYIDNEMPETFYPDYIIQLKSGKVFIGDTKAGNTAKEAGPRAEALQNYIIEQNKKGKNLIGGIIIKDPTGQWRVNQKTEYNYDKNDLTEWDFFDNIISNQ